MLDASTIAASLDGWPLCEYPVPGTPTPSPNTEISRSCRAHPPCRADAQPPAPPKESSSTASAKGANRRGAQCAPRAVTRRSEAPWALQIVTAFTAAGRAAAAGGAAETAARRRRRAEEMRDGLVCRQRCCSPSARPQGRLRRQRHPAAPRHPQSLDPPGQLVALCASIPRYAYRF